MSAVGAATLPLGVGVSATRDTAPRASLPAPATDEVDPLVGQELAPFRVTGLLGRGAMGRVYEGRHALLGRRVAIKVLEPQFARDPLSVARFVDEARAVNGIRHPNIVDITDFGEHAGRPYYVMELLDGETLSARIQREGRLAPEVAVAIGAQVASALAAAHDHGVVHRDLKPDNIYLCDHPDDRDRVKVLDFGVAKLLRRDQATAGAAQTEAGRVLGTPLYMSPEQSLGHAVDHRSDVYALGVVLFECLTGTVPFDRPTAMQVLMAHIGDDPPTPTSLGCALFGELEALVMRALAKQPGARFEDMRHLRGALLSAERNRKRAERPAPDPAPAPTAPPPAPPPPPRSGLTAPVAKALALPTESRSTALADVLRKIIEARIEAQRLVLPAIPASVTAVLRELSTPKVNLSRVAQGLGRDPLIAPQLLRIAGTAYYSSSRRPQNLLEAVVQLGVTRLRSVLLELSARRVFESRQPGVRAAFAGIWAHSVAVATLARMICAELGNPVDPDAVHLGGLLHDVGKPLVGVMLLEAEKVIGKGFKVDPVTWVEIIELAHRRVGVELARSWSLGDALTHAIAHSSAYQPDAPITNIIAFANAVAKQSGRCVGPVDGEQLDEQIAIGAELLGLDWRVVHQLPERLDAELAANP